jgi:hypothetical protein
MSGAGAPPGGGGGSRSFHFGGDDVLCSYDDFAPASSDPKRPDPVDRVIARSVPLFLNLLLRLRVLVSTVGVRSISRKSGDRFRNMISRGVLL